jgi:Gti1/Pac2 family transcription factor
MGLSELFLLSKISQKLYLLGIRRIVSLHGTGISLSSKHILYGLKRTKVEENGISVRARPIFFLCPSPIYALAAYYTQATIDQLGTIDNISRIRDVVVTEGMFKSTRVGRRAKADEVLRPDVRVGTRTYAAFPSPYQLQGQPGTPNSNPVLMHEPYKRSVQPEYFRDQVESSAPYSQRTPSLSPTSPTIGGQYFGDPPYSEPSRSVRSNSYVNHPNPHGDSPYSPQYQPTTTKAATSPASPQHYSNPILSPPWANHDSYYYTRPIHSGPASSPSAPPMSYDHSNSTSQHASQNYTKSYTPSYSLESALTPPQSPPDRRGMALTSLRIPHYTSATQCHTPPDSATAMEDQSEEDQSGLAPLDELKRSRYRREPSDERTLRRLISAQSPPRESTKTRQRLGTRFHPNGDSK